MLATLHEDADSPRPAPEEIKMHKISLLVATAAITALITAWSMQTVVPAKTTEASTSINIIEMMRNAKNLPEQSFDAI